MASQSTSLDRHILAITEPTIKLDPMKFEDMHEGDSKSLKQSRENGSWAPYIKINNIPIDPGEISSFILNAGGFIPTVSFTFDDLKKVFHLDSLPRDGDVINVRITSRQEDTFKDIRVDFDITSFRGTSSLNANPNESRTYMVSGVLKVPTLNAEDCFSYPADTSVEHLKKIATELKLGFASNVDAANDKMTRLCPYMSKSNFIRDIVSHSYVDDDSFQVGSIDPYYYLNFVNLNKVFNSHNELENTLINIFGTDFNMNPKDGNDLNKIKSQMVLSNHLDWGGTSQYIATYQIINNSTAISLANGYSRKLQYFENNSNEKLVSFDVQALSSKKMKELEEPLKGRRDEDRYKKEVKQKYVGRIDADPQHGNINHNYFFASMHNKMNMSEVNKMKLEIHLETINPGLYRYMKIPVLIFSQAREENTMNKHVTEFKKEKGFASEGTEFNTETQSPDDLQNINKQTINELLSGFYIIDEIDYIYDPRNPSLFYQKITLLRREWPSRLNNLSKETLQNETTTPKTRNSDPSPAPVVPPPAPVENPVAVQPPIVVPPPPPAEPPAPPEIAKPTPTTEYTYKLLKRGPFKHVELYRNGTLRFTGTESAAAAESVLLEEAVLAVKDNDNKPDLTAAQITRIN